MKGLHEARKRILQCDRVKQPQHPAERVMTGNAVLEFDDCTKDSLLLEAEFLHLDTGFGPAEHCCQRDEQYFAQVMSCIDVTRVRQSFKYDKETAHPCILQNDEDTRKNPSFTESQVPFYSYAIPLGYIRLGLRERAARTRNKF